MEKWPSIPVMKLEFKPHPEGGLVAEEKIDLGILGEFSLGPVIIDEPDPVKEAEYIQEAQTQAQLSFNEVLLTHAVMVLVNMGEGYFPIVNRYELALSDQRARRIRKKPHEDR